MNKPTLFFIVFLICIASAIAVNPHIPFTSTGFGLQIAGVDADYKVAYTNYSIYWHLYNSTNFRVNASTANCTIHLYNLSSDHVIEAQALGDDGGIDFVWTVINTSMHQPGIYEYNLYCTNGREAGFLRGNYEVSTNNIKTIDVGGTPLAVIILIPLILGMLILAASFMFGEELSILRIFMFFISYIMVFTSFWLGINVVAQYYNFPTFINTIANIIYIIGIIFGVLLVIIMIHTFRMMVDIAAQQKRERLEY